MRERLPEGELFRRSTQLLKEASALDREARIGVNEATFSPRTEYPNLPVCFLLATDIHYGSIRVNYDLLEKHLDVVQNTPNTYLVTNGDDIDAFNSVLHATGMGEDTINPQLQTLAYLDKIKQLDKQGKLAAMSFGNHNEFIDVAGYEWVESFCRNLNTNIFNSGGLLHIKHGNETYNMAMTHKFWGSSKLNPGNACRRFLQWEYPDADVVFLGHTHQSNMELFEIAGKERISVIGGTYKSEDAFAQKHGIGRRSGSPGLAVLLYPNQHRMVGFKDIEVANQFMLANMFEEEVMKQK